MPGRYAVIWFGTMIVLGSGLVFAGIAVWPHLNDWQSGVLGISCGVIGEVVGWFHAMFWYLRHLHADAYWPEPSDFSSLTDD